MGNQNEVAYAPQGNLLRNYCSFCEQQGLFLTVCWFCLLSRHDINSCVELEDLEDEYFYQKEKFDLDSYARCWKFSGIVTSFRALDRRRWVFYLDNVNLPFYCFRDQSIKTECGLGFFVHIQVYPSRSSKKKARECFVRKFEASYRPRYL